MDNEKNLKLQLAIRLAHGSLCLAIGDPKTDGRLTVETCETNGGISAAANLRQAFGSSELLQSGYKRALMLAESPVVLIPMEEYDERQAPALYRYAISGHDKDDIARAEMTELGSVAVFAVNHDVRTVLTDHFADVNFLPLVLPVWRHLYRKAFTGPRQKLFAYFHERRVDIFRFDRGRFRYANAFDCDHAHDALYYLMYIWRLLGMSATDDELYICGEAPHSDWLFENLKKHIQRPFAIDPATDFNISAIARRDDIPYDIKALYNG